MSARWATLLALGLCWPAWWLAGVVVEAVGLGAAALPLRLALLVLALGALRRVVDARG